MKKIYKGAISLLVLGGVVVSGAAAYKNFNKNQTDHLIMEDTDNEVVDATENLYGDTFSNEDNDELKDNQESEEPTIGENIVHEEDKNNKKEEINKDTSSNDKNASYTETSSGTFQGFADGNFIEVKVGDSYQVFKLSSDVKSKAQSKQVGDTIYFTYTASGGQQVITALN